MEVQRVHYLSCVFFFLAVLAALNLVFPGGTGTTCFIIIFLFRYVRVVVNFFAFHFLYKHVETPDAPTTPRTLWSVLPYHLLGKSYVPVQPKVSRLPNSDVAVCIQTIENWGAEFHECLEKICQEKPAQVIICTTQALVGTLEAKLDTILRREKDPSGNMAPGTVHYTAQTVDKETETTHDTPVIVCAHTEANRRRQFLECLKHVLESVEFVIMCDDHVFYPRGFIKFATAPFQDPDVAVVNPGKRVRRTREERQRWAKQAVAENRVILDNGIREPEFQLSQLEYWEQDYLNYIACVYLERHNVECGAAYAMDRGYFVISGRCLPMRKDLWTDDVKERFVNEHWNGRDDILVADDDAWIGREVTRMNLIVAFQYHEQYLLETNLGVNNDWSKFSKQLLRWAKAFFRTGTHLLEDGIAKKRPWTAYAVHLSQLFNFALVLDFFQFWNLWHANELLVRYLARYIIAFWYLTKHVESVNHYRRYPKDLMYAPFSVLFGWYHSLVKACAWLDVDDVAWSGRIIDQQDLGKKMQ